MKWFVLFSVLLRCALSVRGAEPPALWKVGDFTVDGAGVIWGIAGQVPPGGRDPNSVPNRLAVLDASTGQWQPHRCSVVPEEASAERLVTLADGTAACLWTKDGTTILTRHPKAGEVSWHRLPVIFNEPRLLVLANGGLVITGRGPGVARLGGKAGELELAELPDSMLTGPENREGPREYALMHSVQAGDGSLWIWSYSLWPQPSVWRTQGLVRWADGKFTRPGNTPFEAGAMISAVLPDGKEHLFAAQAGVGLYRLNLAGGEAELLPSAADDLKYISRLFWLKDALHLVAGPKPTESSAEMSHTLRGTIVLHTHYHYDTSRRAGSVWRMTGGQFEPLIEGLEMNPKFGWSDRPFAESPEGWLLGTGEGGPWWIPFADGNPPFLLDHQQGFALNRADKMAVIGNNTFLSRGPQHTWSLMPLPGMLPQPAETRRTTINAREYLLQDAGWNIWMLWMDGDQVGRWDGESWHQSPIPEGLRAVEVLEFAADGSNQGWLIPKDGTTTGILDFAAGTWTVFPTLEKAVEDRLAAGDRIHLKGLDLFAPVAGKQRGKGFVTWNGDIHVLTDDGWTRTTPPDIAGPGAKLSGGPFFLHDEKFRLSVNGLVYLRRPDGGWEQSGETEAPEGHSLLARTTKPPPATGMSGITGSAWDRQGVAWLVTDSGRLWKWLDGVGVPVPDHGRNVIFQPGATVEEVMVDPRGNAFIRHQVRDGWNLYSLVRAAERQPGPAAQLVRIEGSTVRVAPTQLPGGWFRWRWEAGQWSKPAPMRELVLEHVRPGPRAIELQSFDAELTPVEEPRKLQFAIEAVGEDALSAALGQLADPDQREDAARTLAAQGTAILPFLQKSLRETDVDDLQWWLRAVIQRIQREAAGTP